MMGRDPARVEHYAKQECVHLVSFSRPMSVPRPGPHGQMRQPAVLSNPSNTTAVGAFKWFISLPKLCPLQCIHPDSSLPVSPIPEGRPPQNQLTGLRDAAATRRLIYVDTYALTLGNVLVRRCLNIHVCFCRSLPTSGNRVCVYTVCCLGTQQPARNRLTNEIAGSAMLPQTHRPSHQTGAALGHDARRLIEATIRVLTALSNLPL